jgi:hypothetical protein
MTGWPRGLVVAVLLSGTLVAVRELQYFSVAYDRFHLPAFDGHVYVAMTEAPGFFTVAPWGYRVLNPWLARAFTWPLRDHSPAFFWSTVLGLGLGGVLLFLYLRRLGNAVLPALLGLTLFGASGPPGEVVRYQFLAEPLTFFLEMALLLAIEMAAPTGLLALIAILGVLSKEFFVFLLPLVWIVGRERDGDRKALLRTAMVVAPALLLTVVLRHSWTPHIRPPLPSLSLETLTVAKARLVQSWPEWRADSLLMGLSPLAIVGALRGRGRRLATRGAYLALVTLVPPFLNPVTFLSDDIPRLLLYALPAALPLSLVALDGLLPRDSEPLTGAGRWPSWIGPTASVIALLSLAAPFAVIDDYRRVDLQGTRDATVMLAVFRGSLEAAGALDAGEPFVFDSGIGRYAEGLPRRHNLSDLRRVRWFLRDGWGASAARQGGEPMMSGSEAHLLLPCFKPRDLEMALRLSAPREARLAVTINGRPVADLLVGPGSRDLAVGVPASTLFRGDNDLCFTAVGTKEPGVRIVRFTFRAM